jgi:hypothetical protein
MRGRQTFIAVVIVRRASFIEVAGGIMRKLILELNHLLASIVPKHLGESLIF